MLSFYPKKQKLSSNQTIIKVEYFYAIYCPKPKGSAEIPPGFYPKKNSSWFLKFLVLIRIRFLKPVINLTQRTTALNAETSSLSLTHSLALKYIYSSLTRTYSLSNQLS